MAMSNTNAVIAAFTEEQVERFTGISQRQLRSWSSGSFYVPSIKLDAQDLSGLRLYSFRDLVCLKVINALRNDAKIPLQELRATKERLAHLGDDMWVKTTLYILGKRVVFDNLETGEKEEARSGQGKWRMPSKRCAIVERVHPARLSRNVASRKTSLSSQAHGFRSAAFEPFRVQGIPSMRSIVNIQR
jgi:DNA-binding transcriptional MerR regulator